MYIDTSYFSECNTDSDCTANAYCDTAICTCRTGYFGDPISEGCKGNWTIDFPFPYSALGLGTKYTLDTPLGTEIDHKPA